MVKLDTVDQLDQWGFFQEGAVVCDIGCGVGYVPRYTMRHRKDIKYHGYDVSLARIKMCRTICNDPRYHFTYLPYNSMTYNPFSNRSADGFIMKEDNNSVDSVICHSLFTHLGTESIAIRYMREINRVLKPNGKLWITFFTSPPNEISDGTERTVYPIGLVDHLLEGFNIISSSGGTTCDYHDQLEVHAVKE